MPNKTSLGHIKASSFVAPRLQTWVRAFVCACYFFTFSVPLLSAYADSWTGQTFFCRQVIWKQKRSSAASKNITHWWETVATRLQWGHRVTPTSRRAEPNLKNVNPHFYPSTKVNFFFLSISVSKISLQHVSLHKSKKARTVKQKTKTKPLQNRNRCLHTEASSLRCGSVTERSHH